MQQNPVSFAREGAAVVIEVSAHDEDYDPYTTVTDEERFAPLRTAALSLFADLAAQYDVARSATFEFLPTMSAFEHAYPPLALRPSHGGAVLGIAFPSAVSLVLRCGWWHVESFPSCACDGCDLTLAHEVERFVAHCAAVVAGSFQETLETAPVWYGSARLSHTFRSGAGVGSSQTGLPPHQAALLRGTRPSESRWMPWTPRVRAAAVGVNDREHD